MILLFACCSEMFDDHPRYSGRAADIWALGATLYCLVVGSPPYMANTQMELIEKLRGKDEPTYPPFIPPTLR